MRYPGQFCKRGHDRLESGALYANGMCKKCAKMRATLYGKKYPEKIKLWRKISKDNNKEKIKEYNKAWRLKNIDRERATSAAWKKANPWKFRAYSWKNKGINLSAEEGKKRYEAQKGLCAICGLEGSKKYVLAADHDHKTGVVRGFLCHKCNNTLVYYVENKPELVLKAKEYLNYWNSISNTEEK